MTKALTVERLRELLEYDPETGDFRWKFDRGSKAPAGAIAGGLNKGYWLISIDGRRRRAHRLAWLYVHGVWPSGEIDHRNENKVDNRIANLREATRRQNTENISLPRRDNKSSTRGVSTKPRKGRPCWSARIVVDGKQRYLGQFDSPEEAAAAYLAAKAELHPFWSKQ